MFTAKILGIVNALVIALIVGVLLYFLPDSAASELLRKAFHLGWPGGVVLLALLFYFQFGRRSDPYQGQLVFKNIVGLLAYCMLFIAIANYVINFNDESPGVSGEPRFLPVSLIIFMVACLTMAMYFQGARVLLQIGAFMLFIAASLAGFGNWLPQVKADPPPVDPGHINVRLMSVQERADLGEKIIFGAVGASGTQGAIGKGQCPLCHGFQKGFLSERAPNLFGVTERASIWIMDARYRTGTLDTVQKEACIGCGNASTVAEYMAESHVCPSCYVVSGFGTKGTNNRESSMPAIHKTPISLGIDELIAVDTWLYVHDGKEPAPYEEIEKAYRKFVPESEWSKSIESDTVPSPITTQIVSGRLPINEIFTKAMCFACHTIPGIQGAVGVVGPKLVEKTNAPIRLKDSNYKGNATTVREYIMESIVTPSRYVTPGFSDNVMPKDFGEKLSAAAINKIVDYLSQLDEGKELPKIQ